MWGHFTVENESGMPYPKDDKTTWSLDKTTSKPSVVIDVTPLMIDHITLALCRVTDTQRCYWLAAIAIICRPSLVLSQQYIFTLKQMAKAVEVHTVDL